MAKQVLSFPGMRDVSLFGELKLLPLDTAVTTNQVYVAQPHIGYARGRQPSFGYLVNVSFACSHANTGKLAFRKLFGVEMLCSAETLAIEDCQERERARIREEYGYIRPIVEVLERQVLLDFKQGRVTLDALIQTFRVERRRYDGASRLRVKLI